MRGRHVHQQRREWSRAAAHLAHNTAPVIAYGQKAVLRRTRNAEAVFYAAHQRDVSVPYSIHHEVPRRNQQYSGAGLGTQFLRHIERTRILVHLVDVSDASGRPDPVEDFEVIMRELGSFGAGLEEKPMIVVASKIDALERPKVEPTKKLSAARSSAGTRGRSAAARKIAKPQNKLDRLAAFCRKKRLKLFPISAVTGEGIDALKYALGKEVEKLRHQAPAA